MLTEHSMLGMAPCCQIIDSQRRSERTKGKKKEGERKGQPVCQSTESLGNKSDDSVLDAQCCLFDWP